MRNHKKKYFYLIILLTFVFMAGSLKNIGEIRQLNIKFLN